MLRKIISKKIYNTSKKENSLSKDSSTTNANTQIEYIPPSINEIKSKLSELFSNTSDFVMRELNLGNKSMTSILIIYIEGMADIELLSENILKPIQKVQSGVLLEEKFTSTRSIIQALKEKVLSCSDIEEISDFTQTIRNSLTGKVILYIDGISVALSVRLPGV